MNRLAFIFALTLLIPSPKAFAQPRAKVEELRDQAHVTLRGKLRIEQRGWRTCFFLETPTQYRVIFDSASERPRVMDLIEISLPGQTRSLRRSSGLTLTATGKIQIEAGSPYYCNGAMLVAEQVSLPNHSILRPLIPPVPPRSITRYSTRVTLIPGADWKFVSRSPSGQPLGAANFAGCSLNGAADILNCSCAEGFQPVKEKSIGPLRQSDETTPENLLQFELDEDARQRVNINVECVRTMTVSPK